MKSPWVRRGLAAAGLVFLTLGTMESAIRLAVRANPQFKNIKASKILWNRLWNVWLIPLHQNRVVPPFRIFANKSFRDEAHLRAIYQTIKAPPNSSWTGYDFFRAPELAKLTEFSVHTNSLGFRDRERIVKKKPGVYRIMALGTCQTFGHAVNDHETYPYVLEDILRKQGGTRRHYEVWNCGWEGTTAIVGLAFLRNEVLKYKPDMLIVDYGGVDSSVLDDDVVIGSAFLSQRLALGNLFKKSIRWILRTPLGGSYLLNRFFYWIIARSRGKNIHAWELVTEVIMEVAREHKLPVILLDQRTSPIPPETYKRLSLLAPNSSFLSIKELFRTHPASADQWDVYRRRYNWGEELGIKDPTAVYFANFFYPNPMGQSLLARGLAERILETPKGR